MSEPLVVSVDASTTACKAIAWNATGHTVAEGRAPLALENPAPGAWEQDARDWWSATSKALRSVTAAVGSGRVAALCIANQRETFVLTDAAGEPLAPARVWMDSRGAQSVADAISTVGAERLHELSGKPPCITPSLYKLLELLRQEPALCTPGTRFCDVHAFLAWKLTDRFATSLAAADPTGLIDMQARCVSPELLRLTGLDEGAMPAMVEPGRELGKLTPEAASATGLSPGLPVIAGAGDGQAAGLGAGIVAPGAAYLNLGTAVVSGVLSSEYVTSRAFRTLHGAAPGSYFLETDLKGGTFTLTWLVERLLRHKGEVGKVLSELEQEAESIPAGSDGLTLVPYWNGVMNPFWDDGARGITIGWHGGHGPAHLYRAVLEGIAFEQRLHTSCVESAIGRSIPEMIVMGGGSTSELWCRILADVLQKPIVRTGSSEATSLGAAVLAARAVGWFKTLTEAASAMTHTGARFEPRDPARYDRLYREVYEPLYPAVRQLIQPLH